MLNLGDGASGRRRGGEAPRLRVGARLAGVEPLGAERGARPGGARGLPRPLRRSPRGRPPLFPAGRAFRRRAPPRRRHDGLRRAGSSRCGRGPTARRGSGAPPVRPAGRSAGSVARCGRPARAPAAFACAGPRGGATGPRRDIVEHVLDAEVAYGRKIGIASALAPAARRAAMLELLGARLPAVRPPQPRKRLRPARYALRRTAWHALDHAFEIEDRSGLADRR